MKLIKSCVSLYIRFLYRLYDLDRYSLRLLFYGQCLSLGVCTCLTLYILSFFRQ